MVGSCASARAGVPDMRRRRESGVRQTIRMQQRADLVLSAPPRRYNRCFEYYKQAQASYWTAEEVDLSQVRSLQLRLLLPLLRLLLPLLLPPLRTDRPAAALCRGCCGLLGPLLLLLLYELAAVTICWQGQLGSIATPTPSHSLVPPN